MALMKKKNRPSGEIPTSSMADIAFLLLVFFLVTTVFDEQRGLRMVLPEADSEVEVSQRNVLHILIQPNGVVHVRRGEAPAVQQTTPAAIGDIWRQEFANNENLIASVKTSPQAPYRYMVDVLDQLQAARAERIALGILEE
ncbi:MAG TPA: biopolymer transporter ExbD [Longimicrobiales bacterium]|nr:biopolymer transporter ExbD [Longimicrobiales bacterium]